MYIRVCIQCVYMLARQNLPLKIAMCVIPTTYGIIYQHVLQRLTELISKENNDESHATSIMYYSTLLLDFFMERSDPAPPKHQ